MGKTPNKPRLVPSEHVPLGQRKRRPRVSRLIPPTTQSLWTTIKGWCALTGMSEAATYNALSRGDLVAKKLGQRVLINVPKGLHWIETLPPPTIRLARAPRRADTAEAHPPPAA